MTAPHLDVAATLRTRARLLAPTAAGNPRAWARLDATLDRLGEIMPLDAYEAFCASLSLAHVGAGYVA